MNDEFDPRDAAVARLLAETPMSDEPHQLERALAAYRNSRAVRRRALPRHALRAGTIGLVTILSGSLAAGYAAALPDPVQRAAHHLLARVGVPAPSHHFNPQRVRHTVVPTPTTTPAGADRGPSRQHDVRAKALLHAPQLRLSIAAREIAGTPALAHVTVDAKGIGHGPLRLEWAHSSAGRWHALRATAIPAKVGVSFVLPAFSRNTWLRATKGGIRTSPHLITVVPTLTATWSRTAGGDLQLNLATVGGSPGDVISVVCTPKRGRRTVVRGRLDRHGHAQFTFASAPPAGDMLVARLPATTRHAAGSLALRNPDDH